jgi:3-hydroxyacyl-CoA dehydrogenase/enoyl-CoA hydratase/3-hydroxybutyryl-CoA epimerase
MSEFDYSVDADGVATIAWDLPGKSMNVMTRDGLVEFAELIDRAHADAAVRGIVVTSAKPDFAGGMDLNVLARMKADAGPDPARGLFDGLMSMHRLLRRLELAGMDPRSKTGGKPTAAALPGTALGIGLEIALACHRRFAADRPEAKIGLPEIKVGIFPGGGGTTRLTRMLGVMAAAPYLMEGKLVDPAAAKAAGLIDEVLPADRLLARARDRVLAAKPADLVKPWDARGWKMPGGGPYHPAGFMTFVGASAMVLGQTQGVYPAARALLSAVYEGALVDFDTALRIEARYLTRVLMNPSSGAMMRTIFIDKEALEKGARRPAVADQKVARLGVLGAGMMGAGIAHVAALAGIPVVLLDSTQENAEKGRKSIETLLDKAIARRRMSSSRKAAILDLVAPTTDFAALAGCDLIVEAVFEDPDVKADVTRRAEAAIGADAIFASNTSTLPISDLAGVSQRPEQFIGIHFFSPVERMMLVEIIRGRQTGDRAVAKALDFARQIRKTPIVVNDARFFYANRCIIPYLNEGVRMLGEGVLPALIENAARLVGMPLGPLQLLDETSIDLGVKIARATRAAMGDAYPDAAADDVLFWMADQGRLGRKAKAGFYAYDEAGKRLGLWPGLAERFPPAAAQPDLAEVQHRLLFAQVLEAVRALEQGVLTDIREGDVGAVLGWGFAPWSGGPFGWLDILGAARAVTICDDLTARHGSRFEAPKLLRDLASRGETFHGRFAARPAAA